MEDVEIVIVCHMVLHISVTQQEMDLGKDRAVLQMVSVEIPLLTAHAQTVLIMVK